MLNHACVMEKLHATIQAGCHLDRRKLCRKPGLLVGRLQIDPRHKSAACFYGKEGQWYTGLVLLILA